MSRVVQLSRWHDHAAALLTVLTDHEKARGKKPCHCVSCRVLALLDEPERGDEL